jgi:predicted dehydrogenase
VKFKVLIVGLGQIGMGYDLQLDSSTYVYSHARAFSRHERFTLIGGVDLDSEKREQFERIYPCPTYLNIDDALQNDQPDVVVLSLPTQFHGEALLRVLDASSPKAILCEKPLSYDVKEAESMVQACNERDVFLAVNYMRRATPGAIEIKRRLDTSEIEKPVKGIAWYSKGFIHNGSHFFNLLEYWLGEVKNWVVLNPGRSCGNTDQEPDVHVTFEHGAITFLAAWEEAFSHYSIELLSPSGRLRYEREGDQITWEKLQSDPSFPGYTILSHEPECIDSGMACYQWHVAEQLAHVLDGHKAQLCRGDEALQTLKTMQHILS